MQENNPINQLPSEPVIQKSNSFLVILLSVLLFVSLVIAGFFVCQTQRLTQELLESRNQNLATLTPTPVATTDPTADWETYESKQLGFEIKYPGDWDVSLETKTQPFESSLFSVVNKDYKLQLNTTTAGYGGIICKFDDSTGDEFTGPGRDEFGDFVSLTGVFGKELRRNKEAISKLSQYGYQRNSFDYSFRVCRAMDNLGTDGKKGYLGIFETKTGITGIVYYTPTNLDQNKLLLLDQILSTFKFTN
ncbi:MAG: hypothetical protein UR39_C0001G0030 [Candidatus Woesebacteria bacterium GW2011_GWA1_33_30]|uniref:Uncharacterized protein n=1 Tax=Candidatus Woesebacteria bacterium GW2011_GWA2_33_28 TaxID=1618561 RepID=A0A0G0CAM7_9BACT|nr:MAG: hypothetical protein UR38_C0001G0031 [Candidatus Woesebacteria bacterium GW2011_GWA2_33_28]KKP48997.1 MAG: hypothetical protein UR39_C0001G0030 [Candidatus Woesebacteria bacterium GW2011_GWA1_33_30]KKP49895.1 MAG: hypothetical protein UR40_C0003G0067 [Microgenomates group bacterium GW2011_GWC1_33_32]KKP52589.1 MAG: hypothetical protein UR44_C0001G0031 [Candidatus Woesebacteria bacterium GW2011_GWB1_33_38]KKP55773.1 MAG: hypothetical protein UR48_C0051G0007 [Microgenomates group bacteriu